ncbi:MULTISPECIES: hypothetical protein [Anaerococcus]|uniref:hypothetical protein n=1 Tax=Anaerococcus TaxID=165779 RepID=UPI0015DED8CC|nr:MULTISPECIES: hypothetical protein [Anaerococcus]MBS6106730.1 hypothetical protein [Anaerococcus sp.]MDU3177212.1 hypothetical protein [Anaerococcus sp.]MDU5535170.1 hypothetical protein [Anaerococcus sp.]
MDNKSRKNLNFIGKFIAISGAILGILHIIPINGILQLSSLGVGLILIIASHINNNDV